MPDNKLYCPHCGTAVQTYRNPAPTVDVIILDPQRGVVLVERKNPPLGYALPGGFIEYGESAEDAARREALEETGLTIRLRGLLGVYSNPERDPRRHTLSVVYVADYDAMDALQAGDDAAAVALHPLNELPPLAFDHALMLAQFKEVLAGTRQLGGLEDDMQDK